MTTMRIAGIDLAWGERNPDGVCCLEVSNTKAKVISLELTRGDEELLSWSDMHLPGDSLVCVDAPVVCPNATGSRPVDRESHQRFGYAFAGCHPANSKRCVRPARIAASLARRGFSAGWSLADHPRLVAEVYPHPAMVRFFGLRERIPYKKGCVASRRNEFRRLQDLLADLLRREFPELEQPLPGLLNLSWTKGIEDQMDAFFCALIGLWHWKHGGTRTDILGDLRNGFLLIPQTPREPEITIKLLELAAGRGRERSFCPSEVARALEREQWPALMPAVRDVAQKLVDRGQLRCTQSGKPASPTRARGPIRLSMP